jgi:hypothetical protein
MLTFDIATGIPVDLRVPPVNLAQILQRLFERSALVSFFFRRDAKRVRQVEKWYLRSVMILVPVDARASGELYPAEPGVQVSDSKRIPSLSGGIRRRTCAEE